MKKNSTKKQTKQEVHVSQNERMRAAARTRKKEKRKKERLLAGGIIMVVLALAAVVGSFSLFYIEGVSVAGNDGEYSDAQIIAAAGLSDVNNMLSFRSENAANAIEWALPYIEQANVKRVLPGNITISVTYAKETYCTQAGNVWICLSREGKVLSTDPNRKYGLILLEGVQIDQYTVGEVAVFADNTAFESAKRLLAAAEQAQVGNVTSVNVTNPAAVKMAIDNRFFVEGTAVGMLEKKMSLIASIVAEKTDKNAHYSLTLASDGSVTVGNYDGEIPFVPQENTDSELADTNPQIPTVVIDPNADSVG